MTNPSAPDTSNDLVIRGADGDPVPLGTRMLEKESYERVVEGLKIMADSAAHLAAAEPQARETWNGLCSRLDIARRIVVQRAGLTDVIKERQTNAVMRNPLPWVVARNRFREGGRQAAGGLRQLATCHRGDFAFSQMAMQIEDMVRKLSEGAKKKLKSRLWMPGQPTRH